MAKRSSLRSLTSLAISRLSAKEGLQTIRMLSTTLWFILRLFDLQVPYGGPCLQVRKVAA